MVLCAITRPAVISCDSVSLSLICVFTVNDHWHCAFTFADCSPVCFCFHTMCASALRVLACHLSHIFYLYHAAKFFLCCFFHIIHCSFSSQLGFIAPGSDSVNVTSSSMDFSVNQSFYDWITIFVSFRIDQWMLSCEDERPSRVLTIKTIRRRKRDWAFLESEAWETGSPPQQLGCRIQKKRKSSIHIRRWDMG